LPGNTYSVFTQGNLKKMAPKFVTLKMTLRLLDNCKSLIQG